jgi:hypothetical protein
VRDFLSLAIPTRPARVVVRVALPEREKLDVVDRVCFLPQNRIGRPG